MGMNVNSNNAVLTHEAELEIPKVINKNKDKTKIIYKAIKRIIDIIITTSHGAERSGEYRRNLGLIA